MGGRQGTGRGPAGGPKSAVGVVQRAAQASDVSPQVIADARLRLRVSESAASLRNATALADRLDARLQEQLSGMRANPRNQFALRAARAALQAARQTAGTDRAAINQRLDRLQTALESLRSAAPQQSLL